MSRAYSFIIPCANVGLFLAEFGFCPAGRITTAPRPTVCPPARGTHYSELSDLCCQHHNLQAKIPAITMRISEQTERVDLLSRLSTWRFILYEVRENSPTLSNRPPAWRLECNPVVYCQYIAKAMLGWARAVADLFSTQSTTLPEKASFSGFTLDCQFFTVGGSIELLST